VGARAQYLEVPLSAGNVISDGKQFGQFKIDHSRLLAYLIEPGYYEDGEFGIRIESKTTCSKVYPRKL
jgi:Xaa-Pro aminopeptidase